MGATLHTMEMYGPLYWASTKCAGEPPHLLQTVAVLAAAANDHDVYPREWQRRDRLRESAACLTRSHRELFLQWTTAAP